MAIFALVGGRVRHYADAECDDPRSESDKPHPSVKKRPELMAKL
jgi:hypothetical protein